MITKKRLDNAKKLLQNHNQAHLWAFWEQLKPPQKQDLLSQIENLDFSRIDDWIARYVQVTAPAAPERLVVTKALEARPPAVRALRH